MISRAYIHITGQSGAGKTTLAEALLRAIPTEVTLCVHAERDDTLRQAKERGPEGDADCKRYLAANAAEASVYRFPEGKDRFMEPFFESRIMSGFSDAVLIEGDSPLGFVHLSAFVARPLPEGESILIEGVKDDRAERRRVLAEAEEFIRHPERLFGLLPSGLDIEAESLKEMKPDFLEEIASDIRSKVEMLRAQPYPDPTRQWKLVESHRGIENAGLVIVNIHHEDERARAEAMVEDVKRLRSDKTVFDDVLGLRGDRIPITAVVANLADPKDAGRKKAIARLKRAIAKAKEE